MKPYTPPSDKGRHIGGHDIHHRTADMPKPMARKASKVAKHSARQHAQKLIDAELKASTAA